MWTATTESRCLESLLCNKRSHTNEKATHRNHRVALVTREYPHTSRNTKAANTKLTTKPCPTWQEKSREGWQHPPHHWSPPPNPSMDSPNFMRPCRGKVSPDIPWSKEWCSYTGVPSTRITRRKRRAAERQRQFIFMALQESSWGCWRWTELLISWLRGGIRQWGGEWGRGGAVSVLFIA